MTPDSTTADYPHPGNAEEEVSVEGEDTPLLSYRVELADGGDAYSVKSHEMDIGHNGELRFFINNRPVALFAPDTWASAVLETEITVD